MLDGVCYQTNMNAFRSLHFLRLKLVSITCSKCQMALCNLIALQELMEVS